MKRIVVILVATLFSLPAAATLRVAATVSNLGMLAREVGGDAVTVTVMAPPNRDPHYLEARPSMMAALRRADIVVAVGAELEIGWLPAAIQGANNRRVQLGQPGHFEAARAVPLLSEGQPADRALGDVHPAGNPHIYLDPERMAQVGFALADRFAELVPARAEDFQVNARRVAARLAEVVADWRARTAAAPGVLAYHSDMDYLLAFLNVQSLGYMEPLPGIPPTAAHLRSIIRDLSDQTGVLWASDFHPSNAGQFLTRQLGWPFHQLPAQVGLNGTLEDYIALIDAWVQTLE